MRDAPRARIERLLEAARSLGDPASILGKDARRELSSSTGLSPEGVDLAFELCLEVHPSEAELDRLLSSVTPSRRSHVLLSANVFVAAHRAIALGLAASPEVCVRSSRREPNMARLLWEQAPDLFELASELAPESGDQLFGYGAETTLRQVAERLPAGVQFRAHGPGFGLLVVKEEAAESSYEELAGRVAPDLVLFDQRGCLSPRLLLFEGRAARALALAEAIANELSAWERRVPRGRLTAEEFGEIARFRDTFSYAGSALSAGSGWVCVAPEAASEMLAPVGRNLVLIPVTDSIRRAQRMARDVTTFAVQASGALPSALAAALPDARAAAFGMLQRPPFDGPVDRRPSPRGARENPERTPEPTH